ncbi:MAG: nuclear transport factor 2 family protein [Methylobacter sp.]
MHDNAQLIKALYTSLDKHDHQSMADCYRPGATFEDIAFKLDGKKQIHAMWAMICRPGSDIQATFTIIHADDKTGEAELIDDYTMSETGRKVHNGITSYFKFQDGLIIGHHDVCDPKKWAEQALGGVTGFFAGRFHFLRKLKADEKLNAFIEAHPEFK